MPAPSDRELEIFVGELLDGGYDPETIIDMIVAEHTDLGLHLTPNQVEDLVELVYEIVADSPHRM